MAIANDTKFNLTGLSYWAQNANESWSLLDVGDDTLRFELHADDHWEWDGISSERSEIAGTTIYAPEETISVSYSFMLEPGAANTASWMLIGQFHADDNYSSPPLAIEMKQERMAIIIRYTEDGQSASNATYKKLWIDTEDIQRGKYYDIKITVNFGGDGDGLLNVWRDGEQIVDYDGPIGYGSGTYWKEGIYRDGSNETIAANFKDLSISSDGGVVIVGTNNSDTVSESETPVGQPSITENGDVITLKSGDDTVASGSGDDVISPGAGNNTVRSGGGNDTITVENGNDVLIGGAGKDTFQFASDFGNNTIKDYEPNKDTISFDGVFDNYKQLKKHIDTYKQGTLITSDDNSIFLKKVKIEKLDDHDFLFT